MSGFDFHIISEITRNLRDRYDSGFPVLKELVQNANDAGATRFSFGHHPGFGSLHTHPLVTGPALWFFNDGNFKLDDINNIKSFGINSKAGDASTIGKFGLGMKSVFHLVEAFLYLGKPCKEKYSREIINPWDNKEPKHLHSDWDHIDDADWQVLEHLANEQLAKGDSPSGFFLWLPLRTRTLLQGKGSIIPGYPGEPGSHELDFLKEIDLAPRLAAVLAMLPHLKRITYQLTNGGFDLVAITAPPQNRLALGCDVVASTAPFYTIEGLDRTLYVAAKHFPATESDAFFAALKASDAWPKSFFRNDVDGAEELANDKSRQEGAVVISHMDGVAGKLEVAWAVFLPLESHAVTIPIPNSSRHYRITLHGQFFVDAGRKGVFGFEDWFEHNAASPNGFDESSLRRTWNKALVERVILPMLLPALEHYCQAWALPDDHIESLTKAISEWLSCIAPDKGTVGDLLGMVCEPGTWARQLTKKDAAWTLKTGTARLLPIPCPPKSDKARPWQIFTLLEKLGYAIDVNASVIAQAHTLQWTKAETLDCLQSMDVTACFTQKGLDYLANWLDMSSIGKLHYLKTPDVQLILVQKIRTGLLDCGLAKTRRFAKPFSRVLASFQSENCIGIGPSDKAANSVINETVFDALWAVECDQLLVPNDLLDQKTNGKPNLACLADWLKALQPLVDQPTHANSAMNAAQALLEPLSIDERKEFLSTNKDLRVIRSKNVRTGKDEPLSCAELHELMTSNALFTASAPGSSGTQPLKLLTDVLPDQSIFQLTKDGREAVFGTAEKLPAPDDSIAILKCVLNSASRIGNQKARKSLIGALNIPAEIDRQDQARLGLRYLVHGEREHRQSQDAMWLRDEDTDIAWQKLWSLLGQTQSWQIVDASFGINLTYSESKKLGIKKIDHAAVIDQMRQDNTCFDWIRGQDFTDEERKEILCKVEIEDLWKKLPLHQFSNGECGCIGPSVFRLGSFQVPADLTAQARFVNVSGDAVLKSRQEDWIPELSHDLVAVLALNSQNPSRYWKLILEALDDPECDVSHNISRIRESAWLPLANGKAIAPQNILHIDGMVDEIKHLASEAGDQFATLVDLQDDFKKHSAFCKVKEDVLPQGKDAFKVILCAIDKLPRYSVGVFPDGQSALIKEALPALTVIATLPGWALIAKAAEQLNLPVGDVLVGQNRPPLNINFVVKLLNELAQGAPAPQTPQYDAHLLYLHSLNLDAGCNTQHIEQLKLRAKDGSWNHAEVLCAGVSGVTRPYLLDDDQQQALHKQIHISNLVANDGAENAYEDANLATWVSNAQKIAHDYFGALATRAKGPAIGFFLAVMGNRYKALAQSYLGNKFPVDEYVLKKLSGNGTDKNQSSFVLLDSINTVTVIFFIVKDAKVDAPNLLGNLTYFPIEKNPETLLVGAPNWVRYGNQSALKVQLASVDTFSQLNGAELNEVLKRTTQECMRKIHGDKQDHVIALWQEINHSDQLNIEIVKRKILDSLPTYLEQLGAHRGSPIKGKLENFKKAQERYFAADSRKNDRGEIEKANQQLCKHAALLADCISEDKQAHQIVLDQMRKKLQDFQYEPDAVLFELFQNADDAAVELARCESNADDDLEVPEPAQRLVVQTEQSVIRFMHWGRLINYSPPNLPDKWRGFGDDLKKMLVLNSSDKPDDLTTTGHFGLGFKSVFLVCDKPRIISGDLMVEICGSILPVPWRATDTVNNLLQKHTTDRSYRGTLIELDITHGKISEIRKRFEQHSSLLTVFSRAIRQIQIDTEGVSNNFAWRPNIVLDGVEVGKVHLTDETAGITTLLVIRTPEGSIALKLGTSGGETIDTKVCPIWVTAPTRETDKIGFFVNGPFSIDAGRGRLAGAQKTNQELLQRIGRHAGQRLAALCENATANLSNWGKLRDDLGLVKECSLPVFWNSIWQVLCKHTITRADSDLSKLVAVLVVSAFKAWIETEVPFPNGLTDQYAGFVRTGGKFVQLEDGWNDRVVLGCLNDLNKHQPSDYVVVSNFMADLLRKSGQQSKIVTLNVDYLIRATCVRERCVPEVAVIFETMAEALTTKNCIFDLSDSAKNQLHFLTESEQWTTSIDLLCDSDLPDFAEERMRYAFAPDRCRLASAYGKAAMAFFVRCRNKMSAPANMLAKWILEVRDLHRMHAALLYIADGQLGGEVANQVRGKGWLADISPKSELFSDFDQRQKDQILRALAIQENINKSWDRDSADELNRSSVPPPTLKGLKALQAISMWWKDEGVERIKVFDRKFWPAEIPRQFDSIYENRASWMTLFGLALMPRLGRVSDPQNRGFIDMMQEKRWWNVFYNSDPNMHGQDWLKVLREYGESQSQSEAYSHWMDNFPRLYRIAIWFDIYTQVFRGLDYREKWQIADYLSPRADPLMSGSGLDAPTLRDSLRLGQHVVVRELLRCNVLTSDAAKALAYKPGASLKRLFALVGYPDLAGDNVRSDQIYDVLFRHLGDAASFDGTYDIPLQIMARDFGLQRQILGDVAAKSDDSDD